MHSAGRASSCATLGGEPEQNIPRTALKPGSLDTGGPGRACASSSRRQSEGSGAVNIMAEQDAAKKAVQLGRGDRASYFLREHNPPQIDRACSEDQRGGPRCEHAAVLPECVLRAPFTSMQMNDGHGGKALTRTYFVGLDDPCSEDDHQAANEYISASTCRALPARSSRHKTTSSSLQRRRSPTLPSLGRQSNTRAAPCRAICYARKTHARLHPLQQRL
ncbi:hypothetical protein PsYK624_131310 [Phanerochaete sordida]|uniref:Uncharacterized protein n=1 Tax=Phanerochaete sordida TaxID=48140 RepID=A0A9P3GL44_9APHY|nr:hypothetical protein PsYK624_131310 [Phanerochaete sordida]